MFFFDCLRLFSALTLVLQAFVSSSLACPLCNSILNGIEKISNITKAEIGIGIPSCIGVTKQTGINKYKTCFNRGNIKCLPYEVSLIHIALPPQCPLDVCTEFHFYNAKHPNETTDITVFPEIKYNNADFDPEKTTWFIVHGFTDNGRLPWIQKMTQALIAADENAQVIVPEWGKGAVGPNLPQGLGNARVVAKLMELVIVDLIQNKGTKLENIKIIAHSLGAHISGYMAKYLKKDYGLQVDKIVMLDVDQLLFEPTPPGTRVAYGDFGYALVYHTSILPAPLGEGHITPIGDADIYWNGGAEQPGCQPFENGEIISPQPVGNLILDIVAFFANCNHQRPQQYLTPSIGDNTCKFVGHRVNLDEPLQTFLSIITQGEKRLSLEKISNATEGLQPSLSTCTPETCITVGLQSLETKPRGVFYVKTNPSPQFCIQEEYDAYKQAVGAN